MKLMRKGTPDFEADARELLAKHMCSAKVKHHSESAAMASVRPNEVRRAYLCPMCRCWHITKARPREWHARIES